MTGWWTVSYVTLWVVVIGLLGVTLVVLRQLGLVYLRVQGTSGFHLDEGPGVGEAVMPFSELDEQTGEPFMFPTADSLNLLVLSSPHCSLCDEALRGLGPARHRRSVAVTVLSEGGTAENQHLRELVGPHGRFVTSLARQKALGVDSLPYAIVTDGEGSVLAKRVVNNVDDLEDLLETAESERAISIPVVYSATTT